VIPADSVENDPLPSLDKVIDLEMLDEFQSHFGAEGPTIIKGLINTFLQNGPNLLTQIQQSLSREDASTLCRLVHTFRSNSGTFGAVKLADLCFNLEEHTKSGSLEGVETMISHIQREFNRARQELILYIEALEAG
jgi:HPt (histidine-containing phosphotransfer) domain-containing protein